MKCPKCKTESFVAFFVQQVEVDRCSSCNGIWFDEQELVHLLTEDARQLTPLREGEEKAELDARRGGCPRDNSSLLRVYSSLNRSVIVDACPQCRGIWLDGGEFEKLLSGGQS